MPHDHHLLPWRWTKFTLKKGPLQKKLQQPAIIFQGIPSLKPTVRTWNQFPSQKERIVFLCHRFSGAKILVSGSVKPPVRNVELISVSNVFGDYPTYDQPSFLRGYVGFQGSSSKNLFKDHLRNPILTWEDLPFISCPHNGHTCLTFFCVYKEWGSLQ